MATQNWIKYNPEKPPGWGPNEDCKVRLRDGRVLTGTQPWLFSGWTHTGGNNDIMEYQSIPAQKDSRK